MITWPLRESGTLLSAFLLLFFVVTAQADVLEQKCNWVQTGTGGIQYESPDKCGHDAVVEGSKPGRWTLNITLAKPAECPAGFTQSGPIQGGVIGSGPVSQYAGDRWIIEARRICIK